MARSAKIYDFTIPAGGSFTLLVEGSYYRILSSSGALEVRRDGGSGVGPIYAGQGERDEEFKRLTLIDKTGAANSGYIIVSDGTFVDDRITGEVSVIDGGKFRTLSGAAFGVGTSSPAVAAQFSGVSIWNPAGSGKNVIVEKVAIATPAAAVFKYGTHTATFGANVGFFYSKKAGAAFSAAQLWVGSAAGVPTGAAPINQGIAPTNQQISWDFKNPVIVPPGFGFYSQIETANQAMYMSAEFYEEAL